MNDILLRKSIQAQHFADDMVARAHKAMTSERGDIVQTVIVIGILVVAAVVVGGIIFAALKSQAGTLGKCIEQVNASAGACTKFK